MTKKPDFFRALRAHFFTFPLCIRSQTRFFSRASRAILKIVHVFPLYMPPKPIFFRALRAQFWICSASPRGFIFQRQFFVAGFYFFKISSKCWPAGFWLGGVLKGLLPRYTTLIDKTIQNQPKHISGGVLRYSIARNVCVTWFLMK